MKTIPIMQCMGGWCLARSKCAHYVAAGVLGGQPSERMCGERDEPKPIREEAFEPEHDTTA